MTLKTSATTALRRKVMIIAYLGCLFVILMVGVVAETLYSERQSIRNHAEQQEGNIALSLADEISREVKVFDVSLLTAARGLSMPGFADLNPTLRQAILFNSAQPTISSGVLVTNEDGRVAYSSLGPDLLGLNVSDRPHFQAHKLLPNLDLVISPPMRSLSDGNWILGISRRFNHPDGSFAGVVIGRIELSFFQKLFDKLNLGDNAIINLVSTDGHLVARQPLLAQNIGRDMSDSKMFNYLKNAPAGVFESVASIDGIKRLYYYQKIPDLPFVVGVGLPNSGIYADWRRKILVISAFVSLVAVFCQVAVWLLRRELLRRERAEAATEEANQGLHEAIARWGTVFNATPDSMSIIHVTRDGSFFYEAVNPVWERVVGIPKEVALGQRVEDCLPADIVPYVVDRLQACLRQRRETKLSVQLKPDGQAQDWEGLVAPVIETDGNIHRIIAVGRDVTERNALEASLRQTQRMEAMGQLTAGVAHDFNNLLQSASGAVELLQDESHFTTQGKRCVTLMENTVSRGAVLVQRLLAFARKQPLNPKLLPAPQVLSGIQSLLDSLLGADIKVQAHSEQGAWSVHADGAQLENCLVNLVLNARDAMPKGGVIRLLARNEEPKAAERAGLAPGEYVRFIVEDQGTGMDTATLARALEPFFTTKPLGEGTGLGLSMVQGFARQSGGDVRIESVVGRGTTVSLWLPRATHQAATMHRARGRFNEGNANVKRIMLVDDEAAVRDTLSLFLSHAGFCPVVAESADAALRLLQAGEFCDLLVTDQSMPGMKGSDLIANVAQLWPDLPTLLMSGYDKVSGLEDLNGRVTILRKPFRRDAFLHQVKALLAATPWVTQPEHDTPNVVPLRGKSS